MGLLSGIYDSAVIQPVAKFKENIAVLSAGVWDHYIVDHIEPMPAGPATTIDMVTVAGATTIGANATLVAAVIAALQLNQSEFLHLRFRPVDDVEGLLFEQSAMQKFATARTHARVDLRTQLYDPYHVSTTFFIVGSNRDMRLETRNPDAVALPAARFIFWGYKYLLRDAVDFTALSVPDRAGMKAGDEKIVRRILGGPTTWIPAEGKAA